MLNISVFHILLYSYYVPFYSRTLIISIIMFFFYGCLLFSIVIPSSKGHNRMRWYGWALIRKKKKHIFLVPMKVTFFFRCFPEIFSCFPIVFVCVPGFLHLFLNQLFYVPDFPIYFPCSPVFSPWFWLLGSQTPAGFFPCFTTAPGPFPGRQGTPRRSMAGATDAEGRWVVGVFHDVVLQNFGSTAGTGW